MSDDVWPGAPYDPKDAPALKALAGAIRGHEAGGPGVVSPQGAKGSGQVMPGTFPKYALPGEQIDDDTANKRVSDRMIRSYYYQYGKDLSRVATSYFSGEASVAPPQSRTPWKRNVSDVNKPVSAYVDNVWKRLTPVGSAQAGEAAQWPGHPLHKTPQASPQGQWPGHPLQKAPQAPAEAGAQPTPGRTAAPAQGAQRPPQALHDVNLGKLPEQPGDNWQQKAAQIPLPVMVPGSLRNAARDPENPIWLRVGSALMETFKRMGTEPPKAVTRLMDHVYKGDRYPTDPPSEQDLNDVANIAALVGIKAPGEGTGAAAGVTKEAGESAVASATEKPPTAIASTEAPKPASLGVASEKPQAPQPQPGGAQATPLADVVRANEAALPVEKDPGLREYLSAAGASLKGMLAPETLRATKGPEAAASIRKHTGAAIQASEQAKAGVEKYRKLVEQAPMEDQLGLIKWIQKPGQKLAKGLIPTPEAKAFLDDFKALMTRQQNRLMASPKTAQMNFIDDYLSQMWKNPDKARSFFAARQGSGGFTKERFYEDYEAGIRAGLVPVTTNPIEIGMRYVENSERFVALNEIIDEGKINGHIVYRNPANKPEGWLELQGRVGSSGPVGEHAYAPPGYAMVYNAFVSHRPEGPVGDLLAGVQSTANFVTAAKLGLSGYHALNMTGESMVSGLANGIKEISGGEVLRGAANATTFLRKPVTSTIRGRQLMSAYLRGSTDPMMKKVVQGAVDANFRVVGKGSIADEYRFTAAGSYWDAWRKGRLGKDLRETAQDIRNRPAVGSAKAIVTLAARTLETVADPLFKVWIPALKSGAFYDMTARWIRQHPNATREEIAAFTRQASDIIDNRFGEMNQDNIFWQRWQKMLAQSALVSYSYTMGTARMAIGAAKDTLATPMRAARGGEVLTDNMAYAIALPIVAGTLGGVYQYLKTGKPPQSLNDAFHPQTGGTDPTTQQPSRAVLPGYMEQFIRLG